MATVAMVEYDDAPPEVRAVYDDIMETRKTDWINNFWKVLANDPPTLARTWNSIKEVMAPRRPRSAHQGADLCRGKRHQRLRVLHPLPHRRRAAAGDDRRHAGRADGGGGHGERNQRARQRLRRRCRRCVSEGAQVSRRGLLDIAAPGSPARRAGSGGGTRTPDPWIMIPLLYRLSYPAPRAGSTPLYAAPSPPVKHTAERDSVAQSVSASRGNALILCRSRQPACGRRLRGRAALAAGRGRGLSRVHQRRTRSTGTGANRGCRRHDRGR